MMTTSKDGVISHHVTRRGHLVLIKTAFNTKALKIGCTKYDAREPIVAITGDESIGYKQQVLEIHYCLRGVGPVQLKLLRLPADQRQGSMYRSSARRDPVHTNRLSSLTPITPIFQQGYRSQLNVQRPGRGVHVCMAASYQHLNGYLVVLEARVV